MNEYTPQIAMTTITNPAIISQRLAPFLRCLLAIVDLLVDLLDMNDLARSLELGLIGLTHIKYDFG